MWIYPKQTKWQFMEKSAWIGRSLNVSLTFHSDTASDRAKLVIPDCSTTTSNGVIETFTLSSSFHVASIIHCVVYTCARCLEHCSLIMPLNMPF